MTKLNASSNASRNRVARVVTRTITLATMINDIHRDRKNATITTKKARVYLRANHANIHERNAAWVFSQSEYDAIRAHFDPKYASVAKSRATRAARKNAPANVTPEPVVA